MEHWKGTYKIKKRNKIYSYMYITPMDESWTTFTNVKESCITRLAHRVQNNFHTVYDIWTHVILVLHTKNTGWWVFITILGKTINMKRVLLFFFFFLHSIYFFTCKQYPWSEMMLPGTVEIGGKFKTSTACGCYR